MAAILVLFAGAAAIWAVPLARRTSLLAGGTIVLLAGTIFGPAFFAINGPIQISLDRVLWGGLVGLTALGVLTGRLEFPKLCRVDFVVAAFAFWLLISCKRGGEVPDGSSPLARWIFFVFVPTAMYFAARMLPDRPKDLRFFLWSMLGLGVYLSVMAVFESRGLHGLVFPKFIVDPGHVEFFGRGRGPLLNPAGNGIVMTVSIIITVAYFFRSGRVGKLVFAAVGLILAAGIYSTLTRSVWLGGAAALGAVGILYTPRWLRIFALIGIVGFGGVMMAGLKDEVLGLKRDKDLSAADAAKSVSLRPLLALVAVEMFKDQPLIGHGFGHYKEHAPKYHTVRHYDMPLEQARPYIQHCVWLSILVDTGIIGLTMFLIIMILLAVIAWTLARAPDAPDEYRHLAMATIAMLCGYSVNGLFHEVAIIEMMHLFLFYIGGLCVNAWMRNGDGVKSNSNAETEKPTALSAAGRKLVCVDSDH